MAYLKQPLSDKLKDLMRLNLDVVREAGFTVLRPDPSCDFCGAPHPVVVYAAKVMADGTPRKCWRWSACERCERAIEEEDHERLVKRLTRAVKKLMAAQTGVRVPERLASLAARRSLAGFKRDAMCEEE